MAIDKGTKRIWEALSEEEALMAEAVLIEQTDNRPRPEDGEAK